MSNVIAVTGFLFLLFFMMFFVGSYDIALCPEAEGITLNQTLDNDTDTAWLVKSVDIVDHAINSRCSRIPFWVNFLIYAPVILGLIYAIIPFK